MTEQAQTISATSTTPRHVAVIMDGNGRWAEQRGKSRSAGHRQGGETVKTVIEAAYRNGVPYLTLFAFSSENWQRPKKEVDMLMELFMRSLRKEVKELHENGARLRFIGDLSAFNPALQEEMKNAQILTRGNQKLAVTIAVGYGGRWDITEACRSIAKEVESGRLETGSITDQVISDRLSLADSGEDAGAPDPDLLIRTGGEQRISNFLLWQMAYTELYFCDTLWPDFGKEGFEAALEWYAQRQRRFGRVPS